MTIRNLLLSLVFVAVPLSMLVPALAWMLGRELDAAEAAQERRHLSHQLAQELLSSSEKLTAFARSDVVTGEPRYRDHFQQVLDLRNGILALPRERSEVYWAMVLAGQLPAPMDSADGSMALEKRMLGAGITLEEFALLKEAQYRSDKLVELEHRAMFDLMRVPSSEQDTGLAMKERAMAIALLHGQEYNEAKASIMDPIGRFTNAVDERTRAELALLNTRASRMLFGLLLTSAALLALFLLMVVLLQRRLVRRGAGLIHTVERIAAGDLKARTGESGSDELALLSRTIDDMAARLEIALDEAHSKARELNEQRAHSEKLLNNILPVLIADRLKKGESNIAEIFPEVTVLFADIVGFTQLSASIAPRQLVHILNDIFGRFDELAVKHGLEKIKTIGDCYMVVGGVPERSSTHCQQVAHFAIDALQALEDYHAVNGQQLSMRIGMHTGTVVAGIVGKQKYSYDLWGDVVNTASRLEGSGLPGRIQVTDVVRSRLSEEFQFESRGPVELKGKGMVDTWFLNGIR